MYLTLGTGQKVAVVQLLIRQSALGFLEGKAAMIRRQVLGTAKAEAVKLFGSAPGFLLLEPAEGVLPRYQIFVDLLCYTPVGPEAHASALICCWFEDVIGAPPADYIETRVRDIDWQANARDIYY